MFGVRRFMPWPPLSTGSWRRIRGATRQRIETKPQGRNLQTRTRRGTSRARKSRTCQPRFPFPPPLGNMCGGRDGSRRPQEGPRASEEGGGTGRELSPAEAKTGYYLLLRLV